MGGLTYLILDHWISAMSRNFVSPKISSLDRISVQWERQKKNVRGACGTLRMGLMDKLVAKCEIIDGQSCFEFEVVNPDGVEVFGMSMPDFESLRKHLSSMGFEIPADMNCQQEWEKTFDVKD